MRTNLLHLVPVRPRPPQPVTAPWISVTALREHLQSMLEYAQAAHRMWQRDADDPRWTSKAFSAQQAAERVKDMQALQTVLAMLNALAERVET